LESVEAERLFAHDPARSCRCLQMRLAQFSQSLRRNRFSAKPFSDDHEVSFRKPAQKTNLAFFVKLAGVVRYPAIPRGLESKVKLIKRGRSSQPSFSCPSGTSRKARDHAAPEYQAHKTA